MRILKITLIILLVVVGILFGYQKADKALSGRNVAPKITCQSDSIQISVKDDSSALLAGVTASDAQDGNLTSQIRIQGISKLISDATCKVTYVVFDSHGNMAQCTRMLTYTDYEKPHFSIDVPLVYTEKEEIGLLDRITAHDCLDENLTESVRVSSQAATSDPDVRMVTLQATNSLGDTARLQIPVVVHTGVVARPEIHLTDYLIYLEQGAQFNSRNYLREITTPEGTGDKTAVKIIGDVDTSAPGTYYVYYRYPYGVTTGISVLTVVVE